MPKKQADRKSSNGSTKSKSTKLTAPKRSAAAQVNKPAAAVPDRKSAPVKTQPKQLASAAEKKRPARKASTIIAERNTAASQPTPAKSRKRAASVVEREEAEDKEDFGTVSIDADSSSEESAGEEENDGEDDQIEEFPELNLESDDDSEDGDDDDGEDEQAEKEESEEEDDDYMAGDSLDEEELDMLEQSKPEIDNYLSANNHERPKLPEIEADYDSDTSTEETENTVGNIPMEWYKDLPHIGYDIDGKRILKPATSDELEKFLAMEEDPDAWKSVHSEKEGKDIVLNDEELDIIRRLQEGEIPDADYNPYEPTVEFFTSKQEIMPLSGAPEPKRRFVPSKWEAKKIMKIVRAIRAGRIVPRKPKDEKPRFYNLWGDDDQPHKDHIMHIPAPKMPLPEHDESYNPPEEYLPDEDEIKAWQEEDEEDRKKNYLPKKYKSLRHVPAYENFVKERFQRCLDLYLAPRVRKNRLNIDPDSLLPKLPSPKDLRPFPTHQSLSYEGHTARIRSISIHPSGLYALSGSDDQTVRLWEVSTGRCLFLWQFDAVIHVVAWNPNRDLWLFAVSIGDGKVLLVSPPKLCSSEQATFTDQFVKSGFALANDQDEEGRPKKKIIEWERASKEEEEKYGFKLRLQHELAVKQITWHRKGDYFATVSPDAKGRALLLHQVTKHQSQRPFRNLKGLVQRVAFHPTKPFFFVATQISVRMYDLMRQTLEKKMQPGAKWISSIDVHPGGDNIIVGTYDKKVCWFDLDLGAYPYKSLRYHTMAVRNVVYHRRYPLFATASDDGTIQIYHGTVYDDLLQNPLIVPVKILRGHEIKSSLGVLDIQFHPTQPWIFSCGADNTFRLWT